MQPGAFVGVVVSIIVLPVSACLLSDTKALTGHISVKFDLVRLVSGYVSFSQQSDNKIMSPPRPAHVLHVLLTARVILHARQQANESYIHEISSSFFTQSY